jgi:hypothetical protein
MKYGLSSISMGAVNYGNAIIERYALDIFKDLGEAHCVFSTFRGQVPSDVEDCDFVLSPGSTCLQKDDAVNLCRANKPILMVGGCVGRGRLEGYQDVSMSNIDTTVAAKCFQPIGVRDSYTATHLTSAGFSVAHVGCPTLFVDLDGTDKGYIAVSLGRASVPEFAKEVRRASTESGLPIYVVAHEKIELPHIVNYLGNDARICDSGNVDDMLSVYANATFVMTGRIHGAIPALMAGKEVAYYSGVPHDSREVLLDDIGLKRCPIEDYSYEQKSMADGVKIARLKANMLVWRDEIIRRLNA